MLPFRGSGVAFAHSLGNWGPTSTSNVIVVLRRSGDTQARVSGAPRSASPAEAVRELRNGWSPGVLLLYHGATRKGKYARLGHYAPSVQGAASATPSRYSSSDFMVLDAS
ncbi:hypothetical protein F4825DRAFT_152556 [Nemania diffusa]|nr:hypothetical protein F4825DRAFT_152556 [Nemania diffusa]